LHGLISTTDAGVDVASRGPAATGLLARERFELRACLGQGAYGTVYEAFDRATGSVVALKVLDRLSADAILRFKREFRALHGLTHRNLVRLRELIQSDGQWLLSMELVAGTDFRHHVRPDDRAFDEAKLRPALVELAQGLSALHAAAHVHRDIKPSNIVVTPSGRVVLLDFGLVMGTSQHSQSMAFDIVGTPAYMAPEQAAQKELTAAADWYAVGVLLFECLTGRLPFEGAPLQLILAKQQVSAPRPRELDPRVPFDLDALAADLLERDPERRIGGEEVLRRLEGMGTSLRPDSAPSLSPASLTRTHAGTFVGRQAELSQLRDSFLRTREGGVATVSVYGESGVGKTRLVQHFVDEVMLDHDALVLRGRCYERETMPYKALDGIVDALSRELRRLPVEKVKALLPLRAGLLPLVFPVLARVRGVTEMSASTRGAQDRVALRALVFTALRDLFARLAEARSLVVIIDDFQWADAESVALLSELLRPPDAPSLLLIVTARDVESAAKEVRQGLDMVASADARHARVELSRLSHEESVGLALQLMSERNVEVAESIAREADGHPMFVEVLVDHHATSGECKDSSLDDALRSKTKMLDKLSSDLLVMVCTAGVPVPKASLREALDTDAASFFGALDGLRALRFVRVHRRSDEEYVEPIHDRVRAAILKGVAEEDTSQRHAVLARALESNRNADRERVALHWHAAKQPERAAACAILAGDQATETLAFAKAARMYGWALRLMPALPDHQRLLVKLAESTANAGRSSEAADLFLKAAEGASASEGLELRRRAAEHLIQSGRIDAGLEIGAQLLASVGLSLPRSRSAQVTRASWHWLKRSVRRETFVARRPDQIPHEQLLRADILWSLSTAIGPVQPFLAAALQAQHFLLALDTGETGRIAQAMAIDIFGLYFMGRHGQVHARLAQAKALAASVDRPEVHALVEYMDGLVSAQDGYLLQSVASGERVVRILSEECIGQQWLSGLAAVTTLSFSAETGDFAAVIERFPRIMRELSERGDPYSRAQGLLWAAALYYVAIDQPAEARKSLNECAVLGDNDLLLSTLSQFRLGAYEGHEQIGDDLLRHAARLTNSGTMKLPFQFGLTRLNLGLAALSSARRSPDRKRLLAFAHEQHRKVRAACRSEAHRAGIVLMLEAAILDVEGDLPRAIEVYTRAQRGSEALGWRLPSLVATLRKAQLVGGSEQKRIYGEIERDMGAQGVVNPLRFMGSLLPGVVDLSRL